MVPTLNPFISGMESASGIVRADVQGFCEVLGCSWFETRCNNLVKIAC